MDNLTWGQDFSTDTEELIFDSPRVRAALFIVYTVIFALCFFGNLAVVLVVTLHWQMRSITKFFLGNLAFANLCVGVFCIFQNLSTYLMDSWLFGVFLCKMYHFTNSLSHTASILILVVISAERYMVLLHCFRYRRVRTRQRLRMIIFGVWGFSALLCAPRLYYIDVIRVPIPSDEPGQPPSSVHICVPRNSLYDSKAADLINFTVLFLLPLAIITILYTKIGIYLRKSERIAESMNTLTAEYSPSMTGDQVRGASSNASSLRGTLKLKSSVCCERNPGTLREPEISGMSITTSSGFVFQDYSQFHHEIEFVQGNNAISGTNYLGEANWKYQAHLNNKNKNNGREDSLSQEALNFQGFCCCRPPNNQQLSSPEFAIPRHEEVHSPDVVVKIATSHTCCQCYFRPPTASGDREPTTKIVIPKLQCNTLCCIQDGFPTVHVCRIESPANKEDPANGGVGLTTAVKCSNGRCGPAGHCNQRRVKKLSQIKNRPRRTVVRMLIIIVVTFAICNLPYHIRKLCQNLDHYSLQSDWSHLFAAVTFLLMYTNCAINPILYAFMSKNFRSSFKDLIKCRWRQNSQRKSCFLS